MAVESGQLAQFRLTKNLARTKIRSLAQDSANLIWGNHARSRMSERGITDVDVLRILRTGHIDEEPRRTENGEWQCKVTKYIRGGRDAGAVVIILHGNKLFLKTV